MRDDIMWAEGHSGNELAASVDELLAATSLYSMATMTPTGCAWINTAYFAYSDEVRLFFVSLADSQHSQNIEGNPSVAVSAYRSEQQGLKRGLQIFGTCKMAHGDDLEAGTAECMRRFKWFAAMEPALREGLTEPAQPRLYVVQPGSIKIFDEARFGKDVWITAAVAQKSHPSP